jgi:hypothetical protein
MLSLTRRKAPQQHTAAPSSLIDLPDDILILICSQCRIDEIFTLRLTSPKIRNLIDEYSSTIGPSVARSTFPLSDHMLSKHTPTSFRSLKALIPEQLAAILIDRHRVADEWLQSRYGVPAEDPFGDELRDRVRDGWRVMRDLSNISREEQRTNNTTTTATHLTNKIFRPALFKIEALKYKEDIILQKRLVYVARLSRRRAQAYKIMFTLLSAAFSTSFSNIGEEYEPWPFDFGDGIDGQRELRKGKTWLAWYILAEGTDLFWQQWWSLPHDDPRTKNYIRDRAIEAFKQTPDKLADHQRTLTRTLQKAINNRAAFEAEFDQSNPVRYFAQYAKERLMRIQNGVSPTREILEHVPFLVNFRCPEEIVKRHEALFAERNASRPRQPPRH